MIGAPKTNTVWVSFIGAAGQGIGIPIRPNSNPLILDDDLWGDALHEEIRAYSENAPEVIGVLEFFG